MKIYIIKHGCVECEIDGPDSKGKYTTRMFIHGWFQASKEYASLSSAKRGTKRFIRRLYDDAIDVWACIECSEWEVSK